MNCLQKNRRISLIAAAALSCVAVQAQDSFTELAQTIASVNPSVAISTYTLKSEQSSLKAAVAPTDPEVTFEYLWPGSNEMTNRWSAGISQELPDFRKMSATGKVVTALDSQIDAEQKSAMREAVYEAETKLIEYISAKKELAMLTAIHENFDSLTATYTKAWERGEVTILDLNKIKIEHARSYAANREAEGTLASLTSEIIALSKGKVTAAQLEQLTDYPAFGGMMLAADGKHGDAVCDGQSSTFHSAGLDDDTLAWLQDAVKQSPQYVVMTEKQNVANEMLNLASKSRFPKFSVGYSHAYEDGVHFNGVTAGVTLPVYSRNAEKAAAESAVFAAQAESDTKLLEIIAQVQADYAHALRLESQLRMLGPAVENTNSIRLLKVALNGGEISLLEYLQEVSYFTEATHEYNVARQDYASTLASLSRYLAK
jgi:outer membrane protein TolC